MARQTITTLIDDLDGSEATTTLRIGWNGVWRELDLNDKNAAAADRALEKYWEAGRPVRGEAGSGRGRARDGGSGRDPRAIRVWAAENGIKVPTRGRIPASVEEQYNTAVAR
jgi:hypothetical protein